MNKRWLALSLLPLVLGACGETPASSEADGSAFLYPNIHNSAVGSLSSSLVGRTALPALRSLERPLREAPGNFVVSPASYLLAVAGLSAVSDNFPNSAFGLQEDGGADLSALINAWNFKYVYDEPGESQKYCSFLSAVAHQQVGSTYAFDLNKRQSAVQDGVSTMVSSLDSYHNDASRFFNDKLGFSIPVPDPLMTTDGVLTYGAFKMKDCVPGGLRTSNEQFLDKSVSSHSFGSVYYPEYLPYYKGENYQAFRITIAYTDLFIVLPDEEVDIQQISLSNALQEFKEGQLTVPAVGYVPYFHVRTEMANFVSALGSKLTGSEVFYSKLLADGVHNNLRLSAVLQTSDFEFSRYGASGESITVIATSGSPAPIEHEVVRLEVNRPFYAISSKDGFPLFANKIMTL